MAELIIGRVSAIFKDARSGYVNNLAQPSHRERAD